MIFFFFGLSYVGRIFWDIFEAKTPFDYKTHLQDFDYFLYMMTYDLTAFSEGLAFSFLLLLHN